MNPHRRYKNYMGIQDILLIILPIFLVLFTVLILSPIHKNNAEKLDNSKPTDGQKIILNDLSGNVESIHPWGRTEVVPIKSVELEYFEYCDEWVMTADIVQPDGRKDYFMPVMSGHINLNVKEMTQTWIQHDSYSTSPDNNAETYEDFRMAHIKIINAEINDIEYSHYRLSPNNTWSIICSWQAKF